MLILSDKQVAIGKKMNVFTGGTFLFFGDNNVLCVNLATITFQGSAPITWVLYGAPSGLTIDMRTGAMNWERTVASRQPYTITVRASNRIGRSQVVLSLTVPLSYNVTIDAVIPSGTLPAPKTVQIQGHVSFFSESTRSLRAFVDVKLVYRQ